MLASPPVNHVTYLVRDITRLMSFSRRSITFTVIRSRSPGPNGRMCGLPPMALPQPEGKDTAAVAGTRWIGAQLARSAPARIRRQPIYEALRLTSPSPYVFLDRIIVVIGYFKSIKIFVR